MVLRIDDRWVMYYRPTTPTGGNFVVLATESDDLVHWQGRHVVYTDECTGTFGGPTESGSCSSMTATTTSSSGPTGRACSTRWSAPGATTRDLRALEC